MRAGQFLDGLARRFDVDLAVVPVAGESVQPDAFVSSRVRRCRVFSGLRPDTHYSLIRAIMEPAARLQAFQSYGRPSLTSALTPDLKDGIQAWTSDQDYTAIHIMRLYLAPLAEMWCGGDRSARPLLTLDCDEDEAVTHAGLAACHERLGRSDGVKWLRAEAKAYRRLGDETLELFDRLFFSASGDAAAHARGVHLPNTSVMPGRFRRAKPDCRCNILFLGTMSYAPNEEAVLWFARHVWPRLSRHCTRMARCMLVGPEPTDAIRQLGRGPDFEVMGPIDEVADAYAEADIAVIPIRHGGGTRIKAIEAAAHRVPMVATPFGAGGLSFRHERDILFAERAPEFAQACCRLIHDTRLADRLADRAHKRVRRLYDRRTWVRSIGDSVAELADSRATPILVPARTRGKVSPYRHSVRTIRSTIVIETRDTDVAAACEHLAAAPEMPDHSSAPKRIAVERNGKRFIVHEDGTPVSEQFSLYALKRHLRARLWRRMLKEYPKTCLLSAASLTSGSRRVLLVGGRRSGKSILALKLVAAGLTFEGDHRVALREGKVLALPRPAHIPQEGAYLLPEFEAAIRGRTPLTHATSTEFFGYDPTRDGYAWRITEGTPDILFMLSPNFGGASSIRKLGTARLTEALRHCAQFPDGQKASHIMELIALASGSTGYDMSVGDPDQAADLVVRVLAGARQ